RATVTDDLRAHALIMHARLLLHADQPGAADLLRQASAAGRLPGGELMAARAAMARLSVERGRDGTQAGIPAQAADTTPGTGAADAAALARLAWETERCAAAAVEMFHV